MTSCYGTYTVVGVNIKTEMVLLPNDEEVANSSKKNIPNSRLECTRHTLFQAIILLHEKFLQFDRLRAVVFQVNLKYLHVKITKLLRVVV